jgi:hypothetical protein
MRPLDNSTSEAAEQSREVQPWDWPGERNPSQWDVHDANQVPEVSFVRRFKAALLLSEDAVGCRRLLTQAASDHGPINVESDISTAVWNRTAYLAFTRLT